MSEVLSIGNFSDELMNYFLQKSTHIPDSSIDLDEEGMGFVKYTHQPNAVLHGIHKGSNTYMCLKSKRLVCPKFKAQYTWIFIQRWGMQGIEP